MAEGGKGVFISFRRSVRDLHRTSVGSKDFRDRCYGGRDRRVPSEIKSLEPFSEIL